jgi:peptidoglycan/LPS O-acetylase OafA/YrhL
VTKRLLPLDGLRGIAVLLVIIWHYGRMYAPEPGSFGDYVMAFVRMSWSGVDLFFVLSGFLIGGILIDNRTASNLWQVFYLRRSLRILPLYTAILFSFFCLLWFGANLPWLLGNPLPLFSYATFTQNFAAGAENSFGANYMVPTWSLAVEEQFYFVLPFVVRFTPVKYLVLVLMALIMIAPLSRLIIYHWYSKDHLIAVYVLTICRADALLLGVICAIVFRSRRAMQFLNDNIFLLRLAGVVSLICLVSVAGLELSRRMMLGGYTVVAVFYSVVLLTSLADVKGPLHWIATRSPLRRLGAVAYGVYLIHMIILGLAHSFILGHDPELRTTSEFFTSSFALVLTLAIAQISFSLFEKHLTSLGHRTSFEGEKAVSPVPAIQAT